MVGLKDDFMGDTAYILMKRNLIEFLENIELNPEQMSRLIEYAENRTAEYEQNAMRNLEAATEKARNSKVEKTESGIVFEKNGWVSFD